MHGEQQSWHDWDPGKYETKRQPKGQIVDRLQNLSDPAGCRAARSAGVARGETQKKGEKIFRLEEAALCRCYERLGVLHSPCTPFTGAQLPGSLCPGWQLEILP